MKEKFKILLFVFLGCLLAVLSFNYIVFGALNFNGLSRINSILEEDKYIDSSYDNDFIEDKELVTNEPVNSAGTSVYNYQLELLDVPEDILSFHLNKETNNE